MHRWRTQAHRKTDDSCERVRDATGSKMKYWVNWETKRISWNESESGDTLTLARVERALAHSDFMLLIRIDCKKSAKLDVYVYKLTTNICLCTPNKKVQIMEFKGEEINIYNINHVATSNLTSTDFTVSLVTAIWRNQFIALWLFWWLTN